MSSDAYAAGDSGDPELDALGYLGDPKTYRQRCERMRVLAVEGKGPLAEMRARLLALGYRPKARTLPIGPWDASAAGP